MTKEIDKLAWLHIQDGKLLVARSKGKKLFYVPGGKREPNESDSQALIREIKEEVSVSLVSDSLKHAGIFKAPADGKANDIIVSLSCYFADYEGDLQSDAEIEQIEFLDYDDKSSCSAGSIVVMDWLYDQGLIK